MKTLGLRFSPPKFGMRFGIRALLILVTIASVGAALIGRPLYDYRVERQVLEQIGAFSQSQAIQAKMIA